MPSNIPCTQRSSSYAKIAWFSEQRSRTDITAVGSTISIQVVYHIEVFADGKHLLNVIFHQDLMETNFADRISRVAAIGNSTSEIVLLIVVRSPLYQALSDISDDISKPQPSSRSRKIPKLQTQAQVQAEAISQATVVVNTAVRINRSPTRTKLKDTLEFGFSAPGRFRVLLVDYCQVVGSANETEGGRSISLKAVLAALGVDPNSPRSNNFTTNQSLSPGEPSRRGRNNRTISSQEVGLATAFASFTKALSAKSSGRLMALLQPSMLGSYMPPSLFTGKLDECRCANDDCFSTVPSSFFSILTPTRLPPTILPPSRSPLNSSQESAVRSDLVEDEESINVVAHALGTILPLELVWQVYLQMDSVAALRGVMLRCSLNKT